MGDVPKMEEIKDYLFFNEWRVERWIGYEPKDIAHDTLVSNKSVFRIKIELKKVDQKFIVYIAVITSGGKKIWLGFSGGLGTIDQKDNAEYTVHRRFSEKTVLLEENVFEAFQRGFSELGEYPVKVFNVRLRASDIDKTEISFFYNITG